MIFKYVIFLLSLCNSSALANNKPFHKIPLTSQNGEKLNWTNYEILIIASKSSSDLAQEWSTEISKHKNIDKNELCAIACVPKWMVRSFSSRFIIKKSICMYENRIPIYIDWGEKFAELNNIIEYPTLIILKHDNDNTYEVGRITGEYSNNLWKKLLILIK
tara:strand:- start:75 stop:557 length:483 start_codon:yes stop_codon:yes gene_type:complete